MSSMESVPRAGKTTLKPQPWRWSHPRVLVEHPDEQSGMDIASGLRFAGYAVALCPGPHGHGKCPLTGPQGCAPAHDADVIVGSLGYERTGAREILSALRTRYPDTPLIVEVPAEIDAELDVLLEGCHTLPAPASAEDLVAAVKSRAEHVPARGEDRA